MTSKTGGLARKGAIIVGAALALATFTQSAYAWRGGCWGCGAFAAGAIAGAAISRPYYPPVYYGPPVVVAPAAGLRRARGSGVPGLPGAAALSLLLPLIGHRTHTRPDHPADVFRNTSFGAPSAPRGTNMNTMRRVLALGAVLIASALSAQAETPQAGAGAPAATPIPTLRCDFKAMSACTPDGDCKEGDQVAGIKIPVRVTVDFENSVVAAVDESGYARADKFDGVAEFRRAVDHARHRRRLWLAVADLQEQRRRLDVVRHRRLDYFGIWNL